MTHNTELPDYETCRQVMDSWVVFIYWGVGAKMLPAFANQILDRAEF